MLAMAAAGEPEGTWLRAATQTGGRGRLGRRWQSPPGNLYASGLVRLRPADPPAPTLGFVAAVALHETASAYLLLSRESGHPASYSSSRPSRSSRETKCDVSSREEREGREEMGGLMLKWPNDLLLDGRKLAGILLERAGDAVVIGIGVNLAHAPELDRPTASLPGAPDPALFLDDLATAFARWLVTWRSEGFASIRARWLDRAHPKGTPLATAEGEGLFETLDETGALILRLADGTTRAIHAGDVIVV